MDTKKHRYHILGIPHTVTSAKFSACAFTQKVVKFGKMMTERGHTVIHYGHEDSDLICTEHVPVLSRDVFEEVYGTHDTRQHLPQYNLSDKAYLTFFKNAIAEIAKRKQPHDFLLPFWGAGVRPICDAHNDMIVVEPGIGYACGHWAKWKVWESYAVLHAFCGMNNVQYSGNMSNYDVVIPNYFDLNDFVFNEKKEDYFLFVGRVYSGKGVNIAIQATQKAGVKLIIAGQMGDPIEMPPHVTYVGFVDIETRKELMKNAKAAIIPSQFLEPFAGVQIENLLSGTPTITADWGAFAENNIHGVTGYRCRTMGDYVDAIKNIDRISPTNCRKWGENFALHKIAPRYEKYFEDVLDVYIGEGWYADGNGLAVLQLTHPCETD